MPFFLFNFSTHFAVSYRHAFEHDVHFPHAPQGCSSAPYLSADPPITHFVPAQAFPDSINMVASFLPVSALFLELS